MLLLWSGLESDVDTKNRRPTRTLAKLPELAPGFDIVGVDNEILGDAVASNHRAFGLVQRN